MKHQDPLDQQIADTLNIVAEQVPVRDRLAELMAGAERPAVRRWRFSEMPALAGVAAFLVGLVIVGGGLLALRNNTNEPSDPAVPVVGTSTTTMTATVEATLQSIEGIWVLESFSIAGDKQSVEIGVNTRQQPWVEIGDSRFAGNFGCNRFDTANREPPTMAAGLLNPGEVASTLALCGGGDGAEGVMAVENVFSEMIFDETRNITVSIANDAMTWSMGDTVLSFVRTDERSIPTTSETTDGTSTTVPVSTPPSSPGWPTVAPSQYLTVDSGGVQRWVAERLVDSFVEPGVERAYLAGSTIVFDTVSTSDIYAYPEPADAPVTAPGGSGGLLFSHFSETQIRLQDVIVVDGRAKALVEEIDEGNFGDELTSGEYVPSRRLMLYDLESHDHTLLIDIPERQSGLSRALANGSVTKVSAAAGLVVVSFRTNTESWLELYTLAGQPSPSVLPYQQPIGTQNVMAAFSPDGTRIAVAIENRVELWDVDGALVREWTAARDGLVTHLDFDGYRIAGTIGSELGDEDFGQFTLEIDSHIVTSGDATARIVFAVSPLPNNALPLSEEPLRDAPDPRSIFDEFESEIIDFAGGNGRLGLIDGEQVITFVCLYDDDEATHPNTNLVVGPIESPGYEALLAAADTVARQRACVPGLLGPFECLGISSDPAACSE